jgi:Mce-associated membrane protein
VAQPAARPTRLLIGTVAVLGVLVLALLAATVVVGAQVVANHAMASDQQDAVAAARQQTVNLTTMSFQTADEDARRLLAGSTGRFHDDFSQRVQSFTDTLKQVRAVTSGQVTETGMERVSGDTVAVLVAATAEVKNTAAPAGTSRDYRMRVTVQRTDGDWLVSGVEFVP